MKEKIFCSECRHCSGHGEEALCLVTYKEYLGAYEVTKQCEKVSDANKDNSCSKFSNIHHLNTEEILSIVLVLVVLIVLIATGLYVYA